jgi:hypothetical protein
MEPKPRPYTLSPFVDWSEYAWKVSPTDPYFYKRLTGGGETLMDFQSRYKFSQHNLFRGINFTLAKPMSTSQFVDKVKNTWEILRFQEPIIALRLDYDERQNIYMTYRAVEKPEALKDWSDRTVRFCEGETDLDELRYKKGQSKIPEENGDQTFLYVIARSETSYGVLFHSHHAPVDGVGMKIMFTKFCKAFASGVDSSSLDWGKEGANLAPGFLSILNDKEVLEGPLYEENLYKVLDDYFQAMDVSLHLHPTPVSSDAELA